ncbi:lysoplasmalogenase family protein [Knoellia koreensis]|uniref:Lysoplasmalogenase n=1 Tax=Knoellia koreensis TaxID=2730921 RepID=A0A849HLD4_9MICO|nr:lysoplasmalogenase [Knoellia sp. DB2414S]
MTTLAWLSVALAAPLDWWAAAVGAKRTETVLKPLVLAALLVAAWSMGGGWALLAALALSLVGDIALLSEAEPRFVVGLGAFLLAHLAYVVAFVGAGMPAGWLTLAGAALVAVAAATAGRRIVPAAAREGGPGLGGACAAYMAVIGVMVVAAWATGRPLVALGATVFMVSDTVLAWNRFVRPLRFGTLAVMVTYHVGQVLIVLGLLR